MRLLELLDLMEAVDPKLGRAFNHLEDLVFFYGSAGTIEALEHLKDMNTADGSNSVRMKWDGNPQIYWGRENGRYSVDRATDIIASSKTMHSSFFIYGFGSAWMKDPSKFVTIELEKSARKGFK